MNNDELLNTAFLGSLLPSKPNMLDLPRPVISGILNNTPKSAQAGTTSRLVKPWKISDKLKPFLAEWESGKMDGLVSINTKKGHKSFKVKDGMILEVYLDSRGIATVGCGHRVISADKLKEGDSISLDRANDFLTNDLAATEEAINEKIKVPLFQHEYDALVSIIFNTGAYKPLTNLATLINGTPYDALPQKIATFWTAGGKSNVGRRQSEANLFKTGVYDATH